MGDTEDANPVRERYISLSSIHLSTEELAKHHRAMSLTKEARAMRELEEEKMKDEADFQEALRLLSLPDHGNVYSKPVSSLLDQNLFEHSYPSPDIDSISAHKSNDELTVKVSYGSVDKTKSSGSIDIAQTLLSMKEDVRHEPQGETRDDTQDEPKDDPQDEHQAEPQDDPQAEPQDDPQAEPQDDPQAEPQDDPQEKTQMMHPPETLFVQKWVSQGGYFDRAVLSFLLFYPDCDIFIEIPKADGKKDKQPIIGWTKETRKKKSK